MNTSRGLAGLVLATLVACGGDGGSSAGTEGGAPAAGGTELTAQQLERGIGPVTELELGALDGDLATAGQAVFELKCSACHKLTERYVGPALGDVLDRRRPEFVMNMILNPAEMVEKHPVIRELLGQFMTPMPNQNLTQDEARSVLEYLRRVQAEPGGAGPGGQ